MKVNTIVINLDHRKDRLNHWKAMIKRVHFVKSWIRLDGIYNIDKPFLGCRDSHRRALEIARDKNWDSVLICEDDVDFGLNCNDIWEKVIKQLPNDWKVVYLGISGGELSYIKKYSKNLVIKNNYSHLTGNFAVLYNSSVYEKAILVLKNTKLLTDWAITKTFSKIYITVPFIGLVIPNDQSDIRKENTNNDLWEYIYMSQRICKAISLGWVSFLDLSSPVNNNNNDEYNLKWKDPNGNIHPFDLEPSSKYLQEFSLWEILL